MKEKINIFFSCILLTATLSFAQKQPQKKTSVLYLNKENANIKAEILNTAKFPSTKQDANYYWYASNKIMCTQGGCEGRLLHGSYSSFYRSNNLQEKGKFKKGLKHGKWISWYENGKIQEITHWKKGKKSSSYMLYNEQGDMVINAHFRNNMLHGKMISYEGGKVLNVKQYKKGKEVIKKEKVLKREKDTPPRERKKFQKPKFFKEKKNKSEKAEPKKKEAKPMTTKT